MKLDNSEDTAKEAEELQLGNTTHRGPKKRPSLKLQIDPTSRQGPKNRPSLYKLIIMKMLHIRPPSHSAVSPSQKSDTSADSSDSSSDVIPATAAKPTSTTPPTSRNPLRLLPLKHSSSPEPTPQPRIETILSPGLPEIVTSLLTTYGLPVHAGFIDPSFSIYLPAAISPDTNPDCAVSFKLSHGAAIMYGDPICAPDRVGEVFDSFCAYAKRRKWKVAVIAGTSRLVDHAVKGAGWGAMEFGMESILNPNTNVIAAGKGFQTIRRDNRKLESGGWKVELYDPLQVRDRELEAELRLLYKEWREERNARGVPQTYSTVLEPWLVPGACRHLYVRSPDTRAVMGLATLLRCGGVDGYLLDPLLKSVDAPRGVTEYLTTHALSMLRDEGGTQLTFGFAPLNSFHSMLNVPAIVEKPARMCYAKLQQHLALNGKIVWHEKWRPERKEALFLLFPPNGVTSYIMLTRALTGVTHIRFRDVVAKGGEAWRGKGNSGGEDDQQQGAAGKKKGAGKSPEVVVGERGVKAARNRCIRWPSTSCYWPGRKLTGIHSNKKLTGAPSNKKLNGVPNGIYNGVSNGMPNGVQNGVQNGTLNGTHNGVHNGIQNGVQNGVRKGMQNGIQNGIHHPGRKVES